MNLLEVPPWVPNWAVEAVVGQDRPQADPVRLDRTAEYQTARAEAFDAAADRVEAAITRLERVARSEAVEQAIAALQQELTQLRAGASAARSLATDADADATDTRYVIAVIYLTLVTFGVQLASAAAMALLAPAAPAAAADVAEAEAEARSAVEAIVRWLVDRVEARAAAGAAERKGVLAGLRWVADVAGKEGALGLARDVVFEAVLGGGTSVVAQEWAGEPTLNWGMVASGAVAGGAGRFFGHVAGVGFQRVMAPLDRRVMDSLASTGVWAKTARGAYGVAGLLGQAAFGGAAGGAGGALATAPFNGGRVSGADIVSAAVSGVAGALLQAVPGGMQRGRELVAPSTAPMRLLSTMDPAEVRERLDRPRVVTTDGVETPDEHDIEERLGRKDEARVSPSGDAAHLARAVDHEAVAGLAGVPRHEPLSGARNDDGASAHSEARRAQQQQRAAELEVEQQRFHQAYQAFDHRMGGLSGDDLREMYHHGGELQARMAEIEIVRRVTRADDDADGKVVTWQQLMGARALDEVVSVNGVERSEVQQDPGEGKTLTLMLYVLHRLRNGGVLHLLTNAPDIADRDCDMYRGVLSAVDGDAYRMNPDIAMPKPEGRATLYVGTMEDEAQGINKGHVVPGRERILDESDAVRIWNEGLFVLAEGSGEVAPDFVAAYLTDIDRVFRRVTEADGKNSRYFTENEHGRHVLTEEGKAEFERELRKDRSDPNRPERSRDQRRAQRYLAKRRSTLAPERNRKGMAEDLHRVEMAAQAHWDVTLDDDFIIDRSVPGGEHVRLINVPTGWVMHDRETGNGSTYQDGLHQALEVVHGVTVHDDPKIRAAIHRDDVLGSEYSDRVVGISGTTDGIRVPRRASSRLRVYDKFAATHTDKMTLIADDTVNHWRISGGPQVIICDANGEAAKIYHELKSSDGRDPDKRVIMVDGHTQVMTEEQLKQKAEAEFGDELDVAGITNFKAYWQLVIAHAGENGKVLVTTRIASRATDINVDRDLEGMGGMTVRLTAHSVRSPDLDRQAYTRAGRTGPVTGDDGTTTITSQQGTTVFYNSLDDPFFTRHASVFDEHGAAPDVAHIMTADYRDAIRERNPDLAHLAYAAGMRATTRMSGMIPVLQSLPQGTVLTLHQLEWIRRSSPEQLRSLAEKRELAVLLKEVGASGAAGNGHGRGPTVGTGNGDGPHNGSGNTGSRPADARAGSVTALADPPAGASGDSAAHNAEGGRVMNFQWRTPELSAALSLPPMASLDDVLTRLSDGLMSTGPTVMPPEWEAADPPTADDVWTGTASDPPTGTPEADQAKQALIRVFQERRRASGRPAADLRGLDAEGFDVAVVRDVLRMLDLLSARHPDKEVSSVSVEDYEDNEAHPDDAHDITFARIIIDATGNRGRLELRRRLMANPYLLATLYKINDRAGNKHFPSGRPVPMILAHEIGHFFGESEDEASAAAVKEIFGDPSAVTAQSTPGAAGPVVTIRAPRDRRPPKMPIPKSSPGSTDNKAVDAPARPGADATDTRSADGAYPFDSNPAPALRPVSRTTPTPWVRSDRRPATAPSAPGRPMPPIRSGQRRSVTTPWSRPGSASPRTSATSAVPVLPVVPVDTLSRQRDQSSQPSRDSRMLLAPSKGKRTTLVNPLIRFLMYVLLRVRSWLRRGNGSASGRSIPGPSVGVVDAGATGVSFAPVTIPPGVVGGADDPSVLAAVRRRGGSAGAATQSSAPAPARHHPESPAASDGLLAVDDWGPADADAVFVVLHDMFGTPVPSPEWFAEHRQRWIVVHLPGFGDSPLRPGHGIVDVVGDIHATVRHHLGERRFGIIGHGTGGRYAMELAALVADQASVLHLVDVPSPRQPDGYGEAGMSYNNYLFEVYDGFFPKLTSGQKRSVVWDFISAEVGEDPDGFIVEYMDDLVGADFEGRSYAEYMAHSLPNLFATRYAKQFLYLVERKLRADLEWLESSDLRRRLLDRLWEVDDATIIESVRAQRATLAKAINNDLSGFVEAIECSQTVGWASDERTRVEAAVGMAARQGLAGMEGFRFPTPLQPWRVPAGITADVVVTRGELGRFPQSDALLRAFPGATVRDVEGVGSCGMMLALPEALADVQREDPSQAISSADSVPEPSTIPVTAVPSSPRKTGLHGWLRRQRGLVGVLWMDMVSNIFGGGLRSLLPLVVVHSVLLSGLNLAAYLAAQPFWSIAAGIVTARFSAPRIVQVSKVFASVGIGMQGAAVVLGVQQSVDGGVSEAVLGSLLAGGAFVTQSAAVFARSALSATVTRTLPKEAQGKGRRWFEGREAAGSFVGRFVDVVLFHVFPELPFVVYGVTTVGEWVAAVRWGVVRRRGWVADVRGIGGVTRVVMGAVASWMRTAVTVVGAVMGREGVRAQVPQAWREMRKYPVLIAYSVTSAVVNASAGFLAVRMTLLVAHESGSVQGMVFAAAGAGAVLALAGLVRLFERWDVKIAFPLTQVGQVASAVLQALVYPFDAAAHLLSAARLTIGDVIKVTVGNGGISVFGITGNVFVETEAAQGIPGEKYSQVDGLMRAISGFGGMVGALFGGVALQAIGIGPTGWVAAAGVGVAAVLTNLIVFGLRRRSSTTAQPAEAASPTVAATAEAATHVRRPRDFGKRVKLPWACVPWLLDIVKTLGIDFGAMPHPADEPWEQIETITGGTFYEVPAESGSFTSIAEAVLTRAGGVDTVVLAVRDRHGKQHVLVITNLAKAKHAGAPSWDDVYVIDPLFHGPMRFEKWERKNPYRGRAVRKCRLDLGLTGALTPPQGANIAGKPDGIIEGPPQTARAGSRFGSAVLRMMPEWFDGARQQTFTDTSGINPASVSESSDATVSHGVWREQGLRGRLRTVREWLVAPAGRLIGADFISGASSFGLQTVTRLFVLNVLHSSVMSGAMGAISILPAILFPVVAGVVADRFNWRRTMLVGQGIAVVASLTMGVAIAIGVPVIGAVTMGAILIGAIFLEQAGMQFSTAASNVAVRIVSSKRNVGKNILLDRTASNAANAVGIPSAIFLVGLFPWVAAVFNSLTSAFHMALVQSLSGRLPLGESARPQKALRDEIKTEIEGLVDAWREAMRKSVLRAEIAMTALINFAFSVTFATVLQVAASSHQGWVPTAGGFGGVLGPFVLVVLLRRLPPAGQYVLLTVGVALATLILPLTTAAPLSVALCFFGMRTCSVTKLIVQDKVQLELGLHDMLGRISGVKSMMGSVGVFLGSILSGFILNAWGVTGAGWVSAATSAVVAAITIVIVGGRHPRLLGWRRRDNDAPTSRPEPAGYRRVVIAGSPCIGRVVNGVWDLGFRQLSLQRHGSDGKPLDGWETIRKTTGVGGLVRTRIDRSHDLRQVDPRLWDPRYDRVAPVLALVDRLAGDSDLDTGLQILDNGRGGILGWLWQILDRLLGRTCHAILVTKTDKTDNPHFVVIDSLGSRELDVWLEDNLDPDKVAAGRAYGRVTRVWEVVFTVGAEAGGEATAVAVQPAKDEVATDIPRRKRVTGIPRDAGTGRGESRPPAGRGGLLRRWQHGFNSLRTNALHRFYTGQIISAAGTSAMTAWAPLAILKLTGSVVLTADVQTAVSAITLAITLPAGRLADTLSPRRLLRITSLACLAASVGTAIITVAHLPGAVAAIIGTVVVSAVAGTIGGLAGQSYGRRLARSRAEQETANRLGLSETQASNVVGRGLAPEMGPFNYVFDALSSVAQLIALRNVPDVAPAADRPRVFDGLRVIWNDHYLRGLVALSGLWEIGASMANFQLSTLAARAGISPFIAGAMISAGSLGVLLGVLRAKQWVPKLNIKIFYPVTTLLWAAVPAEYALGASPWVDIATSILVGVAVVLNNINIANYRLDVVAQEFVASASAVGMIVGGLGGILGSQIGGNLLSRVGNGPAGWVATGLFGTVTIGGLLLGILARRGTSPTPARSDSSVPRHGPAPAESSSARRMSGHVRRFENQDGFLSDNPADQALAGVATRRVVLSCANESLRFGAARYDHPDVAAVHPIRPLNPAEPGDLETLHVQAFSGSSPPGFVRRAGGGLESMSRTGVAYLVSELTDEDSLVDLVYLISQTPRGRFRRARGHVMALTVDARGGLWVHCATAAPTGRNPYRMAVDDYWGKRARKYLSRFQRRLPRSSALHTVTYIRQMDITGGVTVTTTTSVPDRREATHLTIPLGQDPSGLAEAVGAAMRHMRGLRARANSVRDWADNTLVRLFVAAGIDDAGTAGMAMGLRFFALLALHNSLIAGSLVMAAELPGLLFGFRGGVVADKRDLWRTMMIGQTVKVVAAIGIGAALVVGVPVIGVPVMTSLLLLGVFTEAAAGQYVDAATQVAGQRMARDTRSMNRWSTGLSNTSEVVGSPSGAVLAKESPLLPVVVNAVTGVVHMAVVWGLRGTLPSGESAEETTSRSTMREAFRARSRELAEVWRVAMRKPRVRVQLFTVPPTAFATAMLLTNVTTVASWQSTAVAGFVTLLGPFAGIVGAFVVNSLLERMKLSDELRFLLGAVGLALSALIQPITTAPVAMALVFAGLRIFGATRSIAEKNFQTQSFPNMRGRIGGLVGLMGSLGLVSGFFLAGVLSSPMDIGMTGWVSAVAMVVAAVASAAMLLGPRLRLPTWLRRRDDATAFGEAKPDSRSCGVAARGFLDELGIKTLWDGEVASGPLEWPVVERLLGGRLIRVRLGWVRRFFGGLLGRGRWALLDKVAGDLVKGRVFDGRGRLVDNVVSDSVAMVVSDGKRSHVMMLTVIDGEVFARDGLVSGYIPYEQWKRRHANTRVVSVWRTTYVRRGEDDGGWGEPWFLRLHYVPEDIAAERLYRDFPDMPQTPITGGQPQPDEERDSAGDAASAESPARSAAMGALRRVPQWSKVPTRGARGLWSRSRAV